MVKGFTFGILLMLAAQIIMPVNDGLAKYLVGVLPALQIAWARFFFNAVWLVPIVLYKHGPKAFNIDQPALQLLRGLVIVSANLCFVFGIRHVPLADALAIVFVAPLAVAALSAKFLNEEVSPLQWLAIAIGFAGALVIIRPGFSELSLAALLPLAAGLQYAVYLVLSRYLAASSPPEVTLAFTASTGAILLSFGVPFVWQTPTLAMLGVMFLVGTLSGIGHLCITTAHVYAPASVLAPLTYLAIITATILGYLWFDDLPDVMTWTGAGIVVLSGIFLWWTQKRQRS